MRFIVGKFSSFSPEIEFCQPRIFLEKSVNRANEAI